MMLTLREIVVKMRDEARAKASTEPAVSSALYDYANLLEDALGGYPGYQSRPGSSDG